MKKVALVGAHGSYFDAGILSEVMDLFPNLKGSQIDLVDLRLKRDFLQEDVKYDLVVLFYIFISGMEEQLKDPMYGVEVLLGLNPLDTRVSPLHSPENWRIRLQATEAEEILIFGHSSQSEVTGEYIGELPGYAQEVTTKETGSIWRYYDSNRQSLKSLRA